MTRIGNQAPRTTLADNDYLVGQQFGSGPSIPTGPDFRISGLNLRAQIVPMTANGDLLTRIAGVVTRLAAGAAGQILGLAGGIPAWIWPAVGVSTSATEPTGPEVGPGYIWLPDASTYLVRNRSNDGWMEITWTPYAPGDIIGTPEGDTLGTPEGDQIGAE